MLQNWQNRAMNSSDSDITGLLLAWGEGSAQAIEALTPLVYQHLHRLARHYMAGERPGHTLQATALVNEAYLRLVDSRRVHWQNRAHFYALAAQLMRRILVDLARSRGAGKRGGDAMRATLDDGVAVSAQRDPALIDLDDALTALAAIDSRKAQVVELKFFGGLDEKEIGLALGISTDTVQRDWKTARAWLYGRLKG